MMEEYPNNGIDGLSNEQDNLIATETLPPPGVYGVHYQPDGVFISLPAEGLEPVMPVMVLYDVNRRGIKDYKPGDLTVRVRQGRQPWIKVAPPQEENPVDLEAYVTVSRDEMTAVMQLLESSKQGRETDINGILDQINASGVRIGLNHAAIEQAINDKRYYQMVEIAKGVTPQKGADGYITFQFETEHDFKPQIQEDGSVDFKNLNMFSSVSKGDVVVTRVPPHEGVPGITVTGKEIPPQKGADIKMPKGKNIEISSDGNRLIAARDGRVDYVRGEVIISDVYAVTGDVDMSVGNIDFVGDMRIQGNVIAGLTLKATGNIEIYGSVEGAELIAGQDIILKKGIQGMDKGILQAGGNIVSSFIERCNVQAGGSVQTDYIVHSTVVAQDKIIVKGRRGRIIGGMIRAGNEIIARSIGAPSGEKTVIEMGSAPELRARLTELNTQSMQMRAQLDKIENIMRVQGVQDNVPADRQEIWNKLLAGREQLHESYQLLLEEIEQVKDKCAKMTNGRVHAFGSIYQDVKITIDSASYTTNQNIDFATFKNSGGQIVFTACEAVL